MVCSKNKGEFSFDISKANHIFYHLLKDQHIKLLDGHNIPSPKELKNKRHCKYSKAKNKRAKARDLLDIITVT